MKIRRKITLGFALIMLLLITGAAITIIQFVRLSENNRALMQQNKWYNDAMINVQEALNLYDYAILALINDTSKKPLEFIARADSLYMVFVEMSNQHRLSSGEEVTLKKFKTDFTHFRQDWISSLISTPDIKYYLTSKEREFRILKTSLNRMMIDFQKIILNDSDRLYEQYKRALTPGIVTLVTSVILILIFNVLISRLYINPLIKITEAVSKFHYKRVFNVEIETKDEIGELAKSIEDLTKNIKK